MWNIRNPYQGDAKKVLCVCSAGLLRSPTTAWILSNEPYNFNTRAAGVDAGHALIPVDAVLIAWADQILVMNDYQVDQVLSIYREYLKDSGGVEESILNRIKNKIIVLNIPDSYQFRDPKLVEIISNKCKEIFGS